MAFIDYYKIMGVKKDIPQKDIRTAYKKRAKQFHPDLHPNDPKAKAKFQALTEAYDVLGDAEKRKKYDQYGENWKQAHLYEQPQWGGENRQGNSGYGFEGFDFGQFGSNGGGFSNFFEGLFGKKRTERQPAPTSDTQKTVSIDLYTALLGGEIIVQTQTSKFKLKVKPTTQHGSKVRLKGKGATQRNGSISDLIITYHVTLPTQLSERQKELLRQMQVS